MPDEQGVFELWVGSMVYEFETAFESEDSWLVSSLKALFSLLRSAAYSLLTELAEVSEFEVAGVEVLFVELLLGETVPVVDFLEVLFALDLLVLFCWAFLF